MQHAGSRPESWWCPTHKQAPGGHPQASAVTLGEIHRTLGASSAAMVRIVRNLAEVRILLVGKAQIFSIADPVETIVGVFVPKAPWSAAARRRLGTARACELRTRRSWRTGARIRQHAGLHGDKASSSRRTPRWFAHFGTLCRCRFLPHQDSFVGSPGMISSM
jgi:hypothetical protein